MAGTAHTPPIPQNTYQRLFAWNEVALDTTALDHTPPPPNGGYTFGQQLGPARSARAMAIANIAMFEAVNAYYQQYQSYAGVPPVSGDVSVDYAIAQSAHDSLVFLYPSQQPRLDAILATDVSYIQGTTQGLAAGMALGQAAALAIDTLRTNDGSQVPDPKVNQVQLLTGVGYWSPDPISGSQVALGYYWPQVKPFVLTSGSQFRLPPPPAVTSKEYTKSYKQVAAVGGDPANGTATTRTAKQTMRGIYWAYDGVPNIGAPPRLYNQIARTLAFQEGLPDVETAARYLALVNTAMADAALASWDTKWYYQFWRPVTAIRYTGGTGNPDTQPDPTWYPLGGQATNETGPNFTPPFPSYPSGHATFGAALFEVLRSYWPDNTHFTFVSDEFDGMNYSDTSQLQKLQPVSYKSMSDAEWDNAASRIWLGVHWSFDATTGDTMGRQVADWVMAHAFLPAGRKH